MTKFTDEQIIKALECCVKTEFISDCAKCKMFAFDCKDIFIENALDLINRQKAEIEELKTEIERKKNQNTLLLKKKCKDINTARKIIKSEAIKDFAERLKERLTRLSVRTKTHGRKTTPTYVDDIANQILHDVVPQEIDNLVKEIQENGVEK